MYPPATVRAVQVATVYAKTLARYSSVSPSPGGEACAGQTRGEAGENRETGSGDRNAG